MGSITSSTNEVRSIIMSIHYLNKIRVIKSIYKTKGNTHAFHKNL